MKEQEAYQMMFRFLEARYFRLPSDALGNLLGEMQLTEDGLPFDQAIVKFDQAIVKEWNSAVEAVITEYGRKSDG